MILKKLISSIAYEKPQKRTGLPLLLLLPGSQKKALAD